MNTDTFTRFIIDNPENILKSFTVDEITFLKNQLFITKEQVLNRYGKYQLNDKGLEMYTREQVFQRMPPSTRTMFWSINNAILLIQLSLDLNSDLESEIKRMRKELTIQQIQIVKLQKELN